MCSRAWIIDLSILWRVGVESSESETNDMFEEDEEVKGSAGIQFLGELDTYWVKWSWCTDV